MKLIPLLRSRWVHWLGLVILIGGAVGWVMTHVPYLLLFGLLLAGALTVAYLARYNFASVIERLLPRQSFTALAAPVPSRRTAPATTGVPVPAVDPQQAMDEGLRAIADLHGIDEVRGALEEYFTVKSKGAPAKQRTGSLFLLVGPAGTGRFTVASNLAKILYGQGLILDPAPVVITADEGRAIAPHALYNQFRELAVASLGRLILFKDGDWLGEVAHAAVGRALSDVAKAHPHRLFVAVTVRAAVLQSFQNVPELRSAWMNTLAPRRAMFPALTAESATAVLNDFARAHAVRLPPLALRRLIVFIDEARDSGAFENAITVQALAEEVYASAAARLKGQDVRELGLEDVETALDQFHF